MNYGIILAGGVGQRMKNSEMPKQFLRIFMKPIVIYTLEKFDNCQDIDKVVISCHTSWLDYMGNLVSKYGLRKVTAIVAGGENRQNSIENGLKYIEANGGVEQDIVVIHDGVRPLIQTNIISENVKAAKIYGSAMTVRPVKETVIITASEDVKFDNFKKRDDTYSLTAPQTFQLGLLRKAFQRTKEINQPIPLLDAALAYTYLGNNIHLVKEDNQNIKITTPEDLYILKAILEMEENRCGIGF